MKDLVGEYEIHLNKCSAGWRPVFQRHGAFRTFKELKAFYDAHRDDLTIADEYDREYTWEDYEDTMRSHADQPRRPMKWEFGPNEFDPLRKNIVNVIDCPEEEAELWTPFIHDVYLATEKAAREKFGIFDRFCWKIDYWRDPDEPFDWCNCEFS